jgi:hypothetical protein
MPDTRLHERRILQIFCGLNYKGGFVVFAKDEVPEPRIPRLNLVRCEPMVYFKHLSDRPQGFRFGSFVHTRGYS